MIRQPYQQRVPDKEYRSIICWKRFPRVCLAHHCLNHWFDHGFDHWYSAGCRYAPAPSRRFVLRLRARTTGSTVPLVGYSWRPGGITRAFVFFTCGFRHCSDHWSTTGRPLAQPPVGGCVPTRSHGLSQCSNAFLCTDHWFHWSTGWNGSAAWWKLLRFRLLRSLSGRDGCDP